MSVANRCCTDSRAMGALTGGTLALGTKRLLNGKKRGIAAASTRCEVGWAKSALPGCILVLEAVVCLCGLTGCELLPGLLPGLFNHNRPPVADAGPDVNTTVGSKVSLDGYASSDPDGDPLSYRWVLVDGPQTVQIGQANSAEASVILPAEGTYDFSLTVLDGRGGSHTDTKRVSVRGEGANNWPIARAGNDQTVAPGTAVTLNGSDSYDEDADPLTYLWSQTDGPDVAMTCHNCRETAFTAPTVAADTVLTFKLKVNDGRGGSATDTVTITIAGPQRYALRIRVEGEGTVALEPSGGSYDSGTTVTLDPTPAKGWRFVQWEGDLTGSTDPATIKMTGNKSVRALFAADEIDPNNTIDPNDGTSDPNDTTDPNNGTSDPNDTIDPNGGTTDPNDTTDPNNGTSDPNNAIDPNDWTETNDTIRSSEWRTGVIDTVVDQDTYTFTGQAGQLVIIQVNQTSGILAPRFELFPPDGGPIEADVYYSNVFGDRGSIALLFAHPLEKSGQYTIRVRDRDAYGTGGYVLSLLNLSGPLTSPLDANGGSIAFEEVKTGAIDPVADQDAYTFTGTAGQRVTIQVNQTSGILAPRIELFPPNGGPLEIDAYYTNVFGDRSSIALLSTHPLERSGQYTIVVRDRDAYGTGEYIMSLHALP